MLRGLQEYLQRVSALRFPAIAVLELKIDPAGRFFHYTMPLADDARTGRELDPRGLAIDGYEPMTLKLATSFNIAHGSYTERHNVLVRLDAGDVVGFAAIADGWLEHLYLAPGWTGRGIGTDLLTIARTRCPAGLQLWTFQVNAGARRFYEREGFRAVESTDGSANEEREPDVRYVWNP